MGLSYSFPILDYLHMYSHLSHQEFQGFDGDFEWGREWKLEDRRRAER